MIYEISANRNNICKDLSNIRFVMDFCKGKSMRRRTMPEKRTAGCKRIINEIRRKASSRNFDKGPADIAYHLIKKAIPGEFYPIKRI